jgi:energy-coupling factor transporter ATP-binding protein EcfA2
MSERKSRPWTRSAIRMLFASFCVDLVMFRRAVENLRDVYMGDDNHVPAFVLANVIEYFDTHHDLPPLDILRSILRTELQDDALSVAEDEQECAEILDVAASLAKLMIEDEKRYSSYQKRFQLAFDSFITEVKRDEIVESIQAGDLSAKLNTAQISLRTALSTGSDRFRSPFLAEMDERTAGKFTLVGNSLIDTYTGGTGPVTGDIVLHAAPRGSGKSTLLDMAAALVATNEQITASQQNRQPEWVYVFNYEKVEDPLTHMLAYVANIPRDRVEQFLYTKDTSHFSTRGNYCDYEKQKFRDLIRKAQSGRCEMPSGEMERLASARELLSRNVMVADFTGSKPEFKKAAEGFVDGVIEFVESHQHINGSPGVAAVMIDYAGTMVRAHMRTLNRVGDQTERKLIEDLPFRLKHMLTNPKRCWAWLAHQLAADEASKQRGTRPDPNKFKDCKAIAENCDYAFVNGMITLKSGLAVFVQSKARRGAEQPDCIGRLDGQFCRWEPVESGYQLVGGRIVDDSEAEMFKGAAGYIPPDEN